MKTSTTGDNKRIIEVLRKALAILFWVLIWQIAAMAVDKEILIVSPLVTIERLFELVGEGWFWKSSFMSLIRIMEGFFVGVVAGIVAAVFTSTIRVINDLLSPIMSVIKATPIASFIILLLVWIKRDNVPLFAVALMVTPIIWANVCEGISSTDKNLLEMAKVFKFSGLKKITKIYIPNIMPTFIAGCTTAMGLAWKAGVAAEVLSLPNNSIGKELYHSKIYIETADLFAWTAVVIILSMILEYLLKKVFKSIGGGYGYRD
ncbi:MAG TPA: ABC transporter permease subunit [Clostridia bacterium]|nr:ABC transporter permease subunit [Clostridia bacterium]